MTTTTESKTELISKIRNAILDMMAKVKFDEENHLYTSTEDGKWLQGVSTVASIVPKEWLSAWGAKEAVKALGFSDFEGDTEVAEQVFKQIVVLETDYEHAIQGDAQDGIPFAESEPKRRSEKLSKYQAILKEAKGASTRKSKAALVDGKAGHEWLENWVKASIRNKKLPNLPGGELDRPLSQFVDWAEREVDEWVLSEARVAYPEKGYAGTLDALAIMKSGNSAIVDFKFASHISEDYFLQTAGYQAAFEPYQIQIDERWIIRLPKTLEIQEWDKKTKKYNMVENTIEAYRVETPYEWDREVFFNALPVKRWINEAIKINNK